MSKKHQSIFVAVMLLAFGLILVPMMLRLFWLAKIMLFVGVATIGWAVNWAVSQLQKPKL